MDKSYYARNRETIIAKAANYAAKHKDSVRGYKRKYRVENAAACSDYLRDYKRSHPCPCGEDNPICLAFHHLRDKKFQLAAATTGRYSLETVKAEVEKCQVLCANCHLKLGPHKTNRAL